MFCTNCGRQLPADGTPCVCGSGQAEPVQAPATPVWTPEPEQPEEDWAGATTLLTWDEVAPKTEEPAPYIPEAETEAEAFYTPEPEQPEEEWAGATTLLTWDEVAPQPAAEPEPVAEPEEQPQEEWAGDTTLLTWDEVNPKAQAEAPVQPEQPVYQNAYPQQPVYTPPQPVYAPPAYNPPAYNAPTYAVQGDVTPAQAVLGKIAQSPLFMVAVIVSSVQLLVGLIASFFPADFLSLIRKVLELVVNFVPDVPFTADELMAQLLDEMGSEVVMALNVVRGVMIGGSLLSLVFPALTVIGLWLIFTSAKKKSTPSAGGFTMLQVVQIINLIGAGASVLAGVISAVSGIVLVAAMVSEMSYMSDTESALMGTIMTVVVIFVLVLLVGVVLNLIYAIKLLGAVAGAKKIVKNGSAEKAVSMFVVIWNFLTAAGILGDVIGKFVLSGALTGIATLCSGAAYVLFTICILQYNKAIKPLLNK